MKHRKKLTPREIKAYAKLRDAAKELRAAQDAAAKNKKPAGIRDQLLESKQRIKRMRRKLNAHEEAISRLRDELETRITMADIHDEAMRAIRQALIDAGHEASEMLNPRGIVCMIEKIFSHPVLTEDNRV